MQSWALDYLICPRTGSPLTLRDARTVADDIVGGDLVADGGPTYPIVDGIPRFVSQDSYCDNFGLQWNTFSRLRSDRYNGSHLIRNTILRRTRWPDGHLAGKTVLECGCGCGNDTEVLLDLGAERILAFDLSNSVNSAVKNVTDPRVTFVQADIYSLPLRPSAFDVVFCHRMIQHTPRPEEAFYSIVQYVRPGGEVLLHSYDRHIYSMLHWKYVLRPLTKRMKPETLMKVLQVVGPPLYSIQTPLLKLFGGNKYGRYAISRAVPFYNYSANYRNAGAHLSDKELFDVSLLDTFDALSPSYDLPHTADSILAWFRKAGLESMEATNRNPVFVRAVAPEPDVVSPQATAH